MATIYQILNTLLPFEWLSHNFMKNALIAILLVTPIFAILGTMVINNKMAFFSDAIGHSALTGIALGVIWGVDNPVWSMITFTIILTIGIIIVKSSNSSSTDTIISVFSSTAVALGIVILSRGGGFSKYSSYLIGDLLSIRSNELLSLLVILVLIIIEWIFLSNKLLVTSINPTLAKSRGINIHIMEYVFSLTVAIVVTISIQWVGLLIINSFLILPAASARNIAENSRQYTLFSIIFAMFSGLAGLISSYYLNTATGSTIVVVLAIIYFITFGFRYRNK